jgi:hypothetical protein
MSKKPFKLISFEKARRDKAKDDLIISANADKIDATSLCSDAETFFDSTGFPEDQDIWDAYLISKENYLKSYTLDEDHIALLFSRNILYPVQVLSDYSTGSFGEGLTDIVPAIVASFLWQPFVEFPELACDSLCTGMVLDISHDLSDYYNGHVAFDNTCPEAQAVIKSIQICDVAEAANVVDNWARKIQIDQLTDADVKQAKELHQKLLLERFIDPEETQLDGLLNREMERLRTNMADDRAILSKHDKKRTFKLIK